jgi:hypothetical protein
VPGWCLHALSADLPIPSMEVFTQQKLAQTGGVDFVATDCIVMRAFTADS